MFLLSEYSFHSIKDVMVRNNRLLVAALNNCKDDGEKWIAALRFSHVSHSAASATARASFSFLISL